MALARKIWRNKKGLSADQDFLRAIPEEVVSEMLQEHWDNLEAHEAMLEDPTFDGSRAELLKEISRLESLLGVTDAEPSKTGDLLTDYLMARQMSGEITPEDLDMTEEDLRRG